MKIYIDWEKREIYKEEELSELIDSMVESEVIDDFESYLANNYYFYEVFDFTEARKTEVRADYEKYQEDTAKRMMSCGGYTIIEVESENKINIKN